MANLAQFLQMCLAYVLTVQGASASSKSYPCAGTHPCVKKFMNQIWKVDTDFFPLRISADDFRTNCSQAQSCLNDATGGGSVVDGSLTAGVSFIYDVCSQVNQEQFSSTVQTCILSPTILQKAIVYQTSWLSDRDQNLASISKTNQAKTFCSILSTYLTNMQVMMKVEGCVDNDHLTWCIEIMKENAYEKYGGFCPCTGNCDCANVKSTNSAVTTDAKGAGYMTLIFLIFFLIGAFLVKRSKRR